MDKSVIPFDVFCGDEYLGTGVADHDISYHYFCPACGNVWARTISARGIQHATTAVHCPEHPPEAGSAYLPPVLYQDFRYYKSRWPAEALVRDFLYLMELNSAPVIAHNLPENPHANH
jgi:hypothetical protein